MTEETFSFRVDSEVERQFMTAAKARERSTSRLLGGFRRVFVQQEHDLGEYGAWFRRQVRPGLDPANAGDLLPHNELEATGNVVGTDQRLAGDPNWQLEVVS